MFFFLICHSHLGAVITFISVQFRQMQNPVHPTNQRLGIVYKNVNTV